MLSKRLLFVVAGVVIAGLAVLLVLRGLNAQRPEPAGASDAIAESTGDPTPEGGRASGEKSRRWQEFTGGAARSSDEVTTALRPLGSDMRITLPHRAVAAVHKEEILLTGGPG